MIRKIEIDNFKCFYKQRYKVGNLTLLAGLNGSGKSSVIQALLCARNLADRVIRGETQVLDLNGRDLAMGTAKEIAYRFRDDDDIHCKVGGDDGLLDWRFTYTSDDSALNEVPVSVDSCNAEYLKSLANIKFLSASRIAPKAFHEYSEVDARNKIVGKDGRYAASVLALNGGDVINDCRVVNDEFCSENYRTLSEQVNAWMRKFAPTTFVQAKKRADESGVDLRFAFGDKREDAGYRPENVGVGLSTVLPILVLLLSAKRGDILVIENPESDIHPKGQSFIAELLARTARAGVQLFVETHSDHIINGLRVAVKSDLRHELDCKLLFFKRHTKNESESVPSGWQRSTAEAIGIVDCGELENYPEDLLDQWLIHEKELMRVELISGDDNEDSSES